MTATLQRRGKYTLFQTPRQNRILVLGDDMWFAWVGGQQGEILVRSDSDHEREHTIQEGEFYLVDFDDDPSFTDMPHLFLEQNGGFQEVILPNGLPTDADAQKRVVGTDKIVDRVELKRHIHSAAREPWPVGDDRELAIPGYNELSVRGAKARLDDLNAEQLRQLRAYELETRHRKTLIHEIDRRLKN